jgi:hypothetical protein
MKEEIIKNINDAHFLEQLYRKNKIEFTAGFKEAFDSIKHFPAAEFWHERLKPELSPEDEEILPAIAYSADVNEKSKQSRFNLTFTIIAALAAGTIVRLPEMLSVPSDIYIISNLAFFIIPFLMIFYIVKNRLDLKKSAVFLVIIILSIAFANLVPGDEKSQTKILTSIHLIFLNWFLLGVIFVWNDYSSTELKLSFLKRNGDVLVLTAIILICGGFLTSMTLALFGIIKVNIAEFYFTYVVVYGLVASPMVANYMLESSPNIINRVAPFISKIFAPLILIMMLGFLAALAFFSKDPFNNREELIVFNVLLVVNLAVILFSFSGSSIEPSSYMLKVLMLLSLVAIVINCVAASAIVYRIAAFGITPNRLAVLGANVLMFINLIIITVRLFRYKASKAELEDVGSSITALMPWYAAWAAVAAFAFPFIFWFS